MNIEQDDEFLKKLTESRDAELWSEFYFRYDRFIFMIIKKIIKNPDEVNDIAQEVRLRVWRKIHLYKPQRSKFTTWLSKIIKNIVIDFLRNKNKYLNQIQDKVLYEENVFLGNYPDLNKIEEDEWHEYVLNLALNNIQKKFSEKVLSISLEALNGKNNTEIARKYNISENTVSVYRGRFCFALSCAIRRLKQQEIFMSKYLEVL